jgi:hypothetical protein
VYRRTYKQMVSMLYSCYCPMVAVALSNNLFSIINNRSLVPQCLSASCGALAFLLLAANSHSLAVGCCLSGVAC